MRKSMWTLNLRLLQPYPSNCQEAIFLEEEKYTIKTNGLTEQPRCDVSFLRDDLNKYLCLYWWKQHSEQKATVETIKPLQSNSSRESWPDGKYLDGQD